MHRRQGEAAAPGQLAPVLAGVGLRGDKVEPVLVARTEQVLPDAGAAEAELLAAGHRPEGEVAGAAGEGLGDAAHQQQVGGAGEKEFPGHAPVVDVSLHGVQQLGLALHLVERDRLATAEERPRVAPGRVDHIEVVEREEAAALGGELPGKGALAGLAGARDHDCRHNAEPGLEAGRSHPWEDVLIHTVNDIKSRCE